jgi:hypothetical protein
MILTTRFFHIFQIQLKLLFTEWSKRLNDFLNQRKNQFILDNRKTLTKEKLEEILAVKIRTEKIAIKDAKLRTFITEDSSRDDLWLTFMM